tara:strand:+ start:925 stop:1038 length:114 start_codon:yes stop_codon:yes gene_type:complete
MMKIKGVGKERQLPTKVKPLSALLKEFKTKFSLKDAK